MTAPRFDELIHSPTRLSIVSLGASDWAEFKSIRETLGLSDSRAYVLLAVVAALGPYACLVVTGPDATFHASGFLVGAALLVTSGHVLRDSGRRAIAVEPDREG